MDHKKLVEPKTPKKSTKAESVPVSILPLKKPDIPKQEPKKSDKKN